MASTSGLCPVGDISGPCSLNLDIEASQGSRGVRTRAPTLGHVSMTPTVHIRQFNMVPDSTSVLGAKVLGLQVVSSVPLRRQG